MSNEQNFDLDKSRQKFHQAKKKKCGFPVSSYKNLGRVGRF